MDAVAFWKKIGGKQKPSEEEVLRFLSVDDKTLCEALLKSVMVPQDVAGSRQVLEGLAWGLPREFQRVRQAIDKPQKVEQEASEGFEDFALDEAEASYADRAAQELEIFKGMIAQRLKMISSGAIDEVRAVLSRPS